MSKQQQMTDFLIELSINPDKLEQFETDPVGMATAAGFTQEETEVLISRDPDVMRDFLGFAAKGTVPKGPMPKKPKKPTKKKVKK